MEKIKEILEALMNSDSPTGFEFYGESTIKDLAEGLFDEIKTDKVGNFLLIKKSNKKGAKKLLIDAHYDTVGLMVTGLHKGGFLSVTSLGGLDTSVLPSTEVTVLGKEKVYGMYRAFPHRCHQYCFFCFRSGNQGRQKGKHRSGVDRRLCQDRGP